MLSIDSNLACGSSMMSASYMCALGSPGRPVHGILILSAEPYPGQQTPGLRSPTAKHSIIRAVSVSAIVKLRRLILATH